jgi:pseudouridine synthase
LLYGAKRAAHSDYNLSLSSFNPVEWIKYVVSQRLQKLLAQAGHGSRRASEVLITEGRVTVNGRIAELGMQADTDVDDIRVNGAKLILPQEHMYVMLNKPRGVISDEDVAGNWPRARDIIPIEGHLFPVGRLDVQSEGLMLFTSDGDLSNHLTHPRYEHPKVYRIEIDGNPTEKTLEIWRRGVVVEGQRTAPASVKKLNYKKGVTLLEVVVHEGKKRQLRRVAGVLGLSVISLVRISLGPLNLGGLKSGAWRKLTPAELIELRKIKTQKPPRRVQVLAPKRADSPRDTKPSDHPRSANKTPRKNDQRTRRGER